MKNAIIIGGGAAGLMAAAIMAEKDAKVMLFEKNDRLGRKLSITGKGRCNITNAVETPILLENIIGNPSFLYSAFNALDAQNLIDFFNSRGLKTVTERGNRVFPETQKAHDVVNFFAERINKKGITIKLGTSVKNITVENQKVKGVTTQDGKFHEAQAVLIATGGLSYPATGSTGDGYKFAKDTGHRVTNLSPALTPLLSNEAWVKELQGLSLRNVKIKLKSNDKIIYTDFGEMLFTHNGVSGPIILSASRFMETNRQYTLLIDLKPALNEKELDQRIMRDFQKYINKSFKNGLNDLLPQKMIPIIIELCKIPPTKKICDITKQERTNLVNLIKNLQLTVINTPSFKEAVITAGGVSTNQINPKTMESRLIKGLYFAGEIIDVDGLCGGFNLQIAFSTAYLAAKDMLRVLAL